jgi:hypothetical protein
MYPIIAGFSSSGLNHKDYCKSLDLKYGTYKYWSRKYKLEQLTDLGSRSNSNFISLSVSPVLPEKKEAIELRYPNGVSLYFGTNVDAQGLATLKKLVLCLD